MPQLNRAIVSWLSKTMLESNFSISINVLRVCQLLLVSQINSGSDFNRNFLLFESIWWNSIVFVVSDRMTKHMDDSEKRNKM